MSRSVEIGRHWHTLRLSTYTYRWPTVMGENPPRGIPFRCLEASYGGRSIQVRLWNWRKR